MEMETRGLGAGSYPEPKEQITRTLEVKCYFTTYVTVYGDNKEDYERQLKELTSNDLLEECDKIQIDSWEEC